ncbi:MAG TPA: AAA family ATPase [Gemmataceae bacterium]|nr:AAA family ATPase [Gemmataceae bacterium]
MHNHTSQATETFPFFAVDAFANGTKTAESQSIEHLARRLGLDRAQLSAVQAVMTWAVFLRPSTDQADRERLRAYLDVMGYLPSDRKIVAHAERSRSSVEDAVPMLLEGFAAGEFDTEAFLDTDTEQLTQRFDGLTRSQIDLLKSILRHQRALDEANLDELITQFPFPVTPVNFFGRFIAGGCDDPRKAIRYLRLCTPFFVRIRSLLEGLANDRFRFLVIQGINAAKEYAVEEPEETDDEAPDKKPGQLSQLTTPVLGKEAADLLHAAIDTAHDFLGDSDGANPTPFACIKVPDLPGFATDHIDRHEQAQLAAEFIDWLLTGNDDGTLLRRKALSIESERDYRKTKRELRQVRGQRKKHHNNAPADQDNKKAMSIWEREDAKLAKKIEELENRIKYADRDRAKRKTILQQLDGAESGRARVRKFREETAQAVADGKRLVFSLLGTADGSVFGKYLDRAFSIGPDRARQGVKWLRQASFLLSSAATQHIRDNRIQGFASIAEQQLRDFSIVPAQMGPSLRFILERILPEKIDPKLSMLLDALRSHVRLPGVSERKHLTYLVRKWSGKKNPEPDDYLRYAFEHAAYLSEPDLQAILLVLRELGFSDVPARCKELSAERFNHAPAILNQFQVYARSYRPNKLGQLPAVFRDIVTLNDYRMLHLDAFGMSEEVQVLERHLINRGIVCIVDTTNFHPELGAVVMEEKIKDDVEKTREVWGDYVRPHERLVRSFARRLMEGCISDELRNHSLVCVRKPGKLDKIWETLIRKFLGIDMNLTPDLGLINKVLSDLTLHDENVILVVDAESVKDLEQYRQFVGLLQRYHIKVILRMREPLPGLPQVLIQPFMDDEIPDRLLAEEPALRRTLGLEESISEEIFAFAAALVKRTRRPEQDNLNLVLHTLNGAAQHARMEGYRGLTEQDVAAAAPSIFHLPDGEQIRHRKSAVDKFLVRAPFEVLGQEQAIRTIGARMKSHVLGVRDVDRPLALLLPGPTGVGKTELMMKFALAMNMPFFHVEGAQFSESHTVARLIGSPSGYVGPDKGILYVFAEENATAIVFFDEIEKMHPDVYTALMNYFDAGILTAGNGETVRRPGHVIVGAANAGAERLHRHMSERGVKDVLAEAFTDRYGNKRPELVRRFEAIPMLALEKEHFMDLLRASLHTLGKRFGFINANLRLVGVDDTAVDLLYEASREVCAYSEDGLRRIGFGDVAPGVRIRTPVQLAAEQDLFFDMRHVSRAFEQLGGESVRQFAEEQYDRGYHRQRNHPRQVKLVGDVVRGRIVLVDVEPTNGHTTNGHSATERIDGVVMPI